MSAALEQSPRVVQLATSAAFWCGGPPGIQVGKHLLPWAGRHPVLTGDRRDVVYVVTDRTRAEVVAAARSDGGDVYRVRPEGQVWWQPGERHPQVLWCERALILEVVQRGDDAVERIRRAAYEVAARGGAR